MKTVFADTLYFVALFNARDQWHQQAIAASNAIAAAQLVTTEDVLVELLNFFSEFGNTTRSGAATQIKTILSRADIDVVHQSHDSFIAGLALYQARPDKGYSLTDCISMNVMRERTIQHILTHDDHFRQEGFTVLI